MRILVADDCPIARKTHEKLLTSWGHEVVTAEDGQAAWDLVSSDQRGFQLAVIDWVMPGIDGLELVRRIRSRTESPYLYTLLVSANDQKRQVVQGIQSGADDYIVKPFNPLELKARVNIAARILRYERGRQDMIDQLAVLARTDGLTSLLNHAAIIRRLSEEISRARREERPLSVLLADIDHFKQVNDTHGHQAGDEVLRQVATLITRGCRDYDIVGRYGGEEFLVVLPGAEWNVARDIAQRMRESAEKRAFTYGQQALRLTISLGYTTLRHNQKTTVTSLVREVDEAMYRAKNGGRNRVEPANIVFD